MAIEAIAKPAPGETLWLRWTNDLGGKITVVVWQKEPDNFACIEVASWPYEGAGGTEESFHSNFDGPKMTWEEAVNRYSWLTKPTFEVEVKLLPVPPDALRWLAAGHRTATA